LTSKHPTTPLASSQINHDPLKVELVEPDRMPAMVKVTWPAHPSLINPEVFPDTAATVATLFSRAHIVLAALKAGGQL
jgi:hypothetical protein